MAVFRQCRLVDLTTAHVYHNLIDMLKMFQNNTVIFSSYFSIFFDTYNVYIVNSKFSRRQIFSLRFAKWHSLLIIKKKQKSR